MSYTKVIISGKIIERYKYEGDPPSGRKLRKSPTARDRLIQAALRTKLGQTPQRRFDNIRRQRKAFVRLLRSNLDGVVVCLLCTLTFREILPLAHCNDLLKAFVTELRKRFGLVFRYVSVPEFQKRGAPHLHLFLTLEKETGTRLWMAKQWNKVTGESELHRQFHEDERNMIPWTMQTGAYLAKQYLAKCDQKNVPEKYHNVGRFWGASRVMTPVCEVLSMEVDGQKKILDKMIEKAVRVTSRHIEKLLKSKGVLKRFRSGYRGYMLVGQSENFQKIMEYVLCMSVNKQDLALGVTI